ncbi:MAG: single-stranded DNA-binding protein [Chitinophagaceae bacterium]|nr:single-stranded DNA-binding protein [Chitinophagaceae bacterium]
MVIIGRLTKDAVVNHLKDERKVAHFTVAVNDFYKPKGQDQGVTVTNYYSCSYWINPLLAEKLKKGTLVELSGRVGINAYTNMQGEAKASLTFHVNDIKIHQFIKEDASPKEIKEKEPGDDLPFSHFKSIKEQNFPYASIVNICERLLLRISILI